MLAKLEDSSEFSMSDLIKESGGVPIELLNHHSKIIAPHETYWLLKKHIATKCSDMSSPVHFKKIIDAAPEGLTF